MKGKRHTTEEEIRILREADGGRAVEKVRWDQDIGAALNLRLAPIAA